MTKLVQQHEPGPADKLPPALITIIQSCLKPEEALRTALVSKTWHEASKNPNLYFRVHVNFEYMLGRKSPLTKNEKAGCAKFFEESPNMQSLLLRDITDFPICPCEDRSAPPLKTLQVKNGSCATFFDKSPLPSFFRFLKHVNPTLKSVTLRMFEQQPWLRDDVDFDLSHLRYINMAVSALPSQHCGSVSDFINHYNLEHVEELVLSKTQLSGPPSRSEGVHRSCVLGPKVGILATRNFAEKPLRVNLADEKRPAPLKLYCSQCNYCLCRRVDTYMRTPPQQSHIQTEIFFDDAIGFYPDQLCEKNINLHDFFQPDMMTPDQIGPNLHQSMYNCPEDCASEDDKMLIAKAGFLVSTRGFEWGCAIADGLSGYDELEN
mmetsp:Transcript_11535/g.23658  ORF Transcript_11535/g.23658 Transcript_11535/m.23658 type:complete len:377 (-) Transcript_11535:3-1133(-)